VQILIKISWNFFWKREKKRRVLEKGENFWKILSRHLSPNITPKIGRGRGRGYGGRGGMEGYVLRGALSYNIDRCTICRLSVLFLRFDGIFL
jgi:hypothetical protein